MMWIGLPSEEPFAMAGPHAQDRDVLGKVLVPYAAGEIMGREFKAG